jgi:hypothetical protein
MIPERDLFVLVTALMLWGGAILAIILVGRYLSKRAASPIAGDPPLYLAGWWPQGVQRRYKEWDVDARRRFWKRLNWTTTWLVWPLVAAAAIAGMVFNGPLPVVVIIAALIFLAMWYAVSGG